MIYQAYTHKARGSCSTYPKALWLASSREQKKFFSWKNRHICISISHHDETLFHCLVQPSHFLDPLPLFVILCGYLQCHQNMVLCGLMYEVKSTSKSPPSTTAIAASNRKDRLYRVYRVYWLSWVPAVSSVPAVLSIPSVLSVANLPWKLALALRWSG